MSKKILDEDGNEEEVFTADEFKEASQKAADLTTEREKLANDIKERDAKIAEQAGQLTGQRGVIKKYSEMGESDKAKLSAVERQLLEKDELLENERKGARTLKRTSIFDKVVGSDDKLKEAAQRHYDLLGTLPESTDEDIARRAAYAVNNARMDLGISEGPNALNVALGAVGIAPTIKAKDEGKSYADSQQGQQLSSALFGAPKEKK